MGERWRIIKSHPNYEVSDLGRVRRRTPGPNTWPGRIRRLGYSPKAQGVFVILYGDEGANTIRINRLVADAFLGPQPEGTFILHKNLDWRDCRLVNMEYGFNLTTRRRQAVLHARGDSRKHGRAKLLPATVREIRSRASAGETYRSIAGDLGLHERVVGKIIRREIYRHVEGQEEAA